MTTEVFDIELHLAHVHGMKILTIGACVKGQSRSIRLGGGGGRDREAGKTGGDASAVPCWPVGHDIEGRSDRSRRRFNGPVESSILASCSCLVPFPPYGYRAAH